MWQPGLPAGRVISETEIGPCNIKKEINFLKDEIFNMSEAWDKEKINKTWQLPKLRQVFCCELPAIYCSKQFSKIVPQKEVVMGLIILLLHSQGYCTGEPLFQILLNALPQQDLNP